MLGSATRAGQTTPLIYQTPLATLLWRPDWWELCVPGAWVLGLGTGHGEVSRRPSSPSWLSAGCLLLPAGLGPRGATGTVGLQSCSASFLLTGMQPAGKFVPIPATLGPLCLMTHPLPSLTALGWLPGQAGSTVTADGLWGWPPRSAYCYPGNPLPRWLPSTLR